ncbi:hypothetical protein BMS3Bbin02_02052 [bacterium BMS3Bbin02]|nr:hypothetical protein BMS3Bbin02_02052 [bacterium BMS3Bbin02]
MTRSKMRTRTARLATRPRGTLLASLVVGIAIVLGGCINGNSPDSSATTSPVGPTTSEVTGQSMLPEEEPTTTLVEPIQRVALPALEPSPVEVFLGWGSVLDQNEAVTVVFEEREVALAECMKREGFDYFPQKSVIREAGVTAGAPSLNQYEFLAQYGYGISTTLGNSSDRGVSGVGGAPDPNADIIAALSDTERTEYDLVRRSCWSAAVAAVPSRTGWIVTGGDGDLSLEDQLRLELNDDLADLSVRIAADSRSVDAREVWSRCMADRGFSYAEPEAVTTELEALVAPIRAALEAGNGVEDLSGTDKRLLEQIQQRELAIGVADAACRPALDTALWDVQVEYEQQFIDERGDYYALLYAEVAGDGKPDE